MPNGHEWKKIFPLGLMSFCCLFSYTILRDTKDVLMITAPGSGAEVIPFLKTYVNLPGAILWTVAYSKLSNMVSQRTIFYSVVSVFIAYFVAFPLFIYPASPILHPHDAANALAAALPTSFMAPISLYRNWTFSMFYFIAEMWGSVVLSILFWGLANQICTVCPRFVVVPLGASSLFLEEINQESEASVKCGAQEGAQHCTETSSPDNVFSPVDAAGMPKATRAQFNNLLGKLFVR